MCRLIFESHCPATAIGIRELRNLIEITAASTVLESALVNRILLCFSEVATNLIKHDASVKKLRVRLSHTGSEIQLRIFDDGQPWDPFEKRLTIVGAVLAEAESGRGLQIVRDQVDLAQYQSSIESQWNCTLLGWTS